MSINSLASGFRFFSAKNCSITIQNNQFEGLTQKMTRFVHRFQFQSGSTIRNSLSAIKSLQEKYSLIVLSSTLNPNTKLESLSQHTSQPLSNTTIGNWAGGLPMLHLRKASRRKPPLPEHRD